uniref:Uncharacterized protein n=1 Tax=Arundo donax TaxID=35708 RepID=A0A0A8YKF5_ARUDO
MLPTEGRLQCNF